MSETLGSEIPFVIRGHHISTLTQLVSPMNSDSKQLARELRDGCARDRGNLTDETVDWNALGDPEGNRQKYWATYAYDLIGATDTQAALFEESYGSTLAAFIDLSDDAVVRLTARGMDGICNACTFQKHCQRPDESAVDAKYLDVFEDVLVYAQSKDTSLDVLATRTSDGDILTTTKAVRRVLAHFAIAKLWQSSLYADAIRRRAMYGNVFAGPDTSEVERYYDVYGHEISQEAGSHSGTAAF
jgi:hypothetical protein